MPCLLQHWLTRMMFMFAVKKNVQMKFARFASGRCGVSPLERVMKDSARSFDFVHFDGLIEIRSG